MRKLFFIVISLLIGLILGTRGSWADINKGLVSYWPFNDNLNDVTGHGYACEMINGTVSYIQGVKGKAIKLPGTPDSRISIVPWVPVNSSLTISGWVKILNLNELWFGYMAPIYSSQDGDFSHGFFLRPITRQNELRIEFGIEAENHTGNSIYYTLDPIEFFGNWHHIAGVVDRENNQIKLYYDGQLVATSILTTGAVYPSKSFIGSYDYITARDGRTRFVSPSHRLDEIRLYNRVLTYEEIQELLFDTNVIPTVTTNTVSSITSNSAVCGGNVTSDGGTPVTARGVCWSITPDPTIINNSKTTNGSGTGTFTGNITGLNPSTKYYVRAYATNSIGTAYGSNVDFTTGNGPTPVITVTSPNGGEYWLTGSAHSITWTTTGTVGNVKIMYTTNNGSSWQTITPSTTNNGSYPWTVPNTVSSQCKVKISEASDENPSDTGDSVFSIISDSHPTIRVNRTKLNFNASTSGLNTGSQKVWIDNSGGGNLNWQLSTDSTWIICTPMSGTNKGIIDVSVNTSGLNPGAYSGKIMISDANATNSPQTITVNLLLKNSQQMQTPFGDFATPIDGSAISNSVPVTGWALDDIEVTNVKIYNSETFIGEAIFIEGARPDIELAYPGYPNNYKAGWGYMLLTNFLPNGGNGSYTIHAKAFDKEGNEVTLGSKTIYCDNAHAVKPFGAIDTPLQGGMASGKNYVNYGWLLTPVPNYIPADGSTISVFVDGVNLGHPTYNIFRADIANLFPGYSNSFGAVGYYYLDTTKLPDGVHSIYWIATDSAGNSDGIGSRYFLIQDTQNSDFIWANMVPGHTDIIDIPISFDRPVEVRQGYTESDLPIEIIPDSEGIVHIQCRELERIEAQVSLPGNEVEGYMIIGNRSMKLPIGSTLDKLTGKFSWIPGPGFIGTYRMAFIETDREGEKNRKNIMVSILPKFSGE
ncbi:MAG: Ig-like domain-containing protein [Candidatus Aminicenantes bacterium]|nr:Ig-like domain-containing protein [Candidatus Aminicenantes bacterium]